jgi:hypothetical protein
MGCVEERGGRKGSESTEALNKVSFPGSRQGNGQSAALIN